MKVAKEVKRSYQSALRGAHAQSTRAAVIAAAGRLFTEQGYAATSIDEIAAAAGVSRATVFTSVGGKATLLKTALDVAIVGDDEPVPLPERPRSKAIRAEPIRGSTLRFTPRWSPRWTAAWLEFMKPSGEQRGLTLRPEHSGNHTSRSIVRAPPTWSPT